MDEVLYGFNRPGIVLLQRSKGRHPGQCCISVCLLLMLFPCRSLACLKAGQNWSWRFKTFDSVIKRIPKTREWSCKWKTQEHRVPISLIFWDSVCRKKCVSGRWRYSLPKIGRLIGSHGILLTRTQMVFFRTRISIRIRPARWWLPPTRSCSVSVALACELPLETL